MREVKLDEIFEIARGGSPRPIKKFVTKDPKGVNWIKIGDTTDSKYITKTKEKIIEEGVSKSRYVEPGDFLLTNSMSFGRPYILKIDGCIHDGWLVLKPKSDQIFEDYFYYILGSPVMKREFKKKAKGTTVKNLNISLVSDVKIPLPSLSEQKAIVAKLDRAQRLIDIDREMLAKYDELIQSVFLEMFGDPVRNEKGWEVKKLGDIVDKLIAGKSFKSTDDETGEYRVIKTGAVSWNLFDKLESKPLPPDYKPPKEHFIDRGDILISRMNTSELVGASVLVQEYVNGYTIPDRIWKVKWKSKDSQSSNYFWRCINHDSFRNEISKIATGTSGSMKNMSKKKMFNMDVILPPIDLQKEFDQICEKIEVQKKNVAKSLKKSEELFSSLVQGVFGS